MGFGHSSWKITWLSRREWWEHRPDTGGLCLVGGPLVFLTFPWEGLNSAPWGSSLTHNNPLPTPSLWTGCFALAKTVYFFPCWKLTLGMICLNKNLIASFSLVSMRSFTQEVIFYLLPCWVYVLHHMDLRSLNNILNGSSSLQCLSVLVKYQTSNQTLTMPTLTSL